MSLTKLAAGSLTLLALVGLASHMGCSEEKPECEKDSACVSANTACTKGVCKDGKCEAQPVTDGTRIADQSPVKDKFCVKLECKAGKPTEVADNSKTPADVPCQKQVCDNMVSKPENVGDGVPCNSSMGACQGGMCVPNPDSGPIGPKDTGTDETGDDASTDDASTDDAATD